jgi:hypothetical protein
MALPLWLYALVSSSAYAKIGIAAGYCYANLVLPSIPAKRK